MNKLLENLSDKELDKRLKDLQEEVERRKKMELEKKKAIIWARLEFFKSINLLKGLKHDRSSCSDENPCNGYSTLTGSAGCRKCHFIEIMQDHEIGEHFFEVELEIGITKIC